MKRLVFLFILCLVAAGVHAQQPQIKILANSAEINGNLVFNGTQRLSFVVSDGKPANAGYAYEFGAVQLIPANGAPVELRAKTVENRNMTIYSLRTNLLQTYPQGFKVRMEGITRHNPNQTTDLLFKAEQLEINVVPQ